MNQTKKRLTIIKLAISMTDTETIELQIDKLALLKSDQAMQDILTSLNAKNYAHAQMLITTYIDTPTQTILQRVSQPEEDKSTQKIEPLIDTPSVEEVENKKDVNKAVNYDALLNIDIDKVLENSIQLKTSQMPQETFFNEKPELKTDLVQRDTFFDNMDNSPNEVSTPIIKKEEIKETIEEKPSKPILQTDLIEKDTFFNDIQENTEKISTPSIKNEDIKETLQVKTPIQPSFTIDEPLVEEKKPLQEDFQIDITPPIHKHKKTIEKITQKEETKPIIDSSCEEIVEASIKDNEQTIEIKENSAVSVTATTKPHDKIEVNLSTGNTTTPDEDNKQKELNKNYPPIHNMAQKLEHMNLRYPTAFNTDEKYPSVEVWIEKISTTGYGESDVENVILQIKELSQRNQAEAGQLLLVTASTQSQYAEFILARELYKGDIIQKNLIEAFNRIHHLAVEKEYPEAMCDLAQFYEKGIGTSIDKVLAQTFYEQAMKLGITRAQGHFERLNKKQKGFFSRLRN
ncbi:MAG: hypothetical protein U9N11_01810 [Campylobacterota bacterium]|nr:hypothetical protein [Campylobacterota bacterium]